MDANDILQAIYHQIGHLAVQTESWAVGEHHRRQRVAIHLARQGVVAIDVSTWLGHEPTDAARRMVHRRLDAMERDGLVIRNEGRATHVTLTPEGEARARLAAASRAARDIAAIPPHPGASE